MPVFYPGLTIGGLYCYFSLPVLSISLSLPFFLPLCCCWKQTAMWSVFIKKDDDWCLCHPCWWKYKDLLFTICTKFVCMFELGCIICLTLNRKTLICLIIKFTGPLKWKVTIIDKPDITSYFLWVFSQSLSTHSLTHIPLYVCSEWLCVGTSVDSRPGLCFFMLFWEMQTYLFCFSEWICILFCLPLLARPSFCAALKWNRVRHVWLWDVKHTNAGAAH